MNKRSLTFHVSTVELAYAWAEGSYRQDQNIGWQLFMTKKYAFVRKVPQGWPSDVITGSKIC